MQYKDLVSIGDVSVSPESRQIYFGEQKVKDSEMGGVLVNKPYILDCDTLLEFENTKPTGMMKYLPHKLVEKDNRVSKSIFGEVEIRRVDEFHEMFKKSSSLSSSEYQELLDVVEFIDKDYEGLVIVSLNEDEVLNDGSVRSNQNLMDDALNVAKKFIFYDDCYFMVRDEDRFVLTRVTKDSMALYGLVCAEDVRDTVLSAHIEAETSTIEYLKGVIDKGGNPVKPHAHLVELIDGVSRLDFDE